MIAVNDETFQQALAFRDLFDPSMPGTLTRNHVNVNIVLTLIHLDHSSPAVFPVTSGKNADASVRDHMKMWETNRAKVLIRRMGNAPVGEVAACKAGVPCPRETQGS